MQKRQNVVGGTILILLGIFFLLNQFMPGYLDQFLGKNFSWPWIIIGIGFIFIFFAIVTMTGDLAIPGCIVGGIGGILNYQAQTGDWESWAYVWTLIPGFVGLGIFLSAIINRGNKKQYAESFQLMIISGIGFVIFGSIFGVFTWQFAQYWPVLLIVYGVWILIKNIFWRESKPTKLE